MKIIQPPFLKKGDIVGITCPASYLSYSNAEKCIQTLQKWGFEVMVGKTLGSTSQNYFSASDEGRAHELQAMLDDNRIKAIIFGRGGYGTGRIIDNLNFSKFKKNPKWLVGFSDITILHAHIHTNLGIAGIHGPMAIGFNSDKSDKKSILSLHDAIVGKKASYTCLASKYNRNGNTKADVVGGNLALLANAIGTSSDLDTKGKILFIEDVGETYYAVDRMLYQLKRSGKLSKLAGLIIGGFTDMKDTERPFGKKLNEIIRDIIFEYRYPVCFGFPVSHSKKNMAIKVGVKYELKVSDSGSWLTEL